MDNEKDNVTYISKHLLKQYMKHIMGEESIGYVKNYFRNPELFTEEEWGTLEQIESELEKELYD